MALNHLSSLSALQLYQLLRYGSFILIGICFAKIGLPREEIGRFETFIMLSSMVSYFWVGGMINTMLSIYPRKKDSERSSVFFNTFLSLSAFSIIAGTLLFTMSDNVLSFMDQGGSGALVRLAVVYLLLNGPSFISEYILFLNDRKLSIVVYGVLFGFSSLCAGVLPIVNDMPVEYSLYGFIWVAVGRYLFTLWLISRYGSFRFNSTLLLQQVQSALPVIGAIFVSGSAEYIDGVLVKSLYSDADFAVYRFGAKELPVLLIVANTFSSAMIPMVANHLEHGLEQIKKNSARLMHLFFPVTILLLFTSPYLYPFLFNIEFASSALIFNIYLLLIIPRVLFPQTILTGIHANRFLFYSSLIEITLNISLSYLLSMYFGLAGIALGTLLSSLADKLFLSAVCYFKFNLLPGRYLLYIPYLVYVALTVVSFIISYIISKAV